MRAPGRVNLIGEHTDYNNGFVLPAAIDRDLCIALRPRSEAVIDVRTEGRGRSTFALGPFGRRIEGWGAYVQGVAWALTASGRGLTGWDGAVHRPHLHDLRVQGERRCLDTHAPLYGPLSRI